MPNSSTSPKKRLKPDFFMDGPNGKVPGYYGLKAIKVVKENLGRDLTAKEKRIIKEEGMVNGLYYDHKGIVTSGVGQTGEFIKKGFEASVNEHEDRVRKLVPDYDLLPDKMQEEMLQSVYRGDLKLSPTAVGLFNQGKYQEAADEFLDHAEYKNPKTPQQIKDRIKSVSDEMRRMK